MDSKITQVGDNDLDPTVHKITESFNKIQLPDTENGNIEDEESKYDLEKDTIIDDDVTNSRIPHREKTLEEINEILKSQDRRRVPQFEVNKLEKDAKRNWDIFYKKNGTSFFKDRNWTLREFQEILDFFTEMDDNTHSQESSSFPVILEVGCGVGNFIYPILKELPKLRAYACDFSPRAIDFVRSHEEFNPTRLTPFVCDITEENCFHSEAKLLEDKSNFISMIFVLSAISPSKHISVINNLRQIIRPGGVIFFRDYGRYDMAQLRFKPGKKIDENFYVRRDGTRSYYFTPEEVRDLFHDFEPLQCDYIHRRTINIKEQIDTERIFVQGKFRWKG